jgi:hypothetical protein
MSIQGSDNSSYSATESVAPPEVGPAIAPRLTGHDRTDEATPLPTRAELMRSVKRKIKSGYYNSDSVLEDLSHGFASALESM